MTLLSYVKGLWTALLPAATKAKMENIEDGIKAASDILDLETDAGRAITQAADAAAQRSALGLGDSVTKNVGTGPGDVAAGDAPAAAQAAAEATAAGALAGHVADADPHTQYQKEEAGKGLSTNDYDNTEKSKLAGIEAGADVTDETNITAAAVGTAEVTAAPDHIWVLVGGLLKRWTKAGFEAVVKALLPSTIEAGTATTTPNDTDVIPGVKSDHSMLKYTWANIKAALATFLDRASTTVKGIVQLAADGGTTAGTVVQANDSRLAVSGSWTPELTIGGASTGITYASRSGTYRKTNGFCICTARIQLSSKGALTGALGLSGFPAVSNAVNASYAIVHTDGWAGLLSAASLYISASANVATFRSQTATASSPLTNANITDGAYINFLIVYAL